MRTGAKNAPPVNVDAAYELYRQGEVEQARKLINEILAKTPNHLQASALRDRIDNDEFQQWNAQTRELQAVEQVNPAAPWGWLIVAVGAAVIATVVAIPTLNEMLKSAQSALVQDPDAPAVAKAAVAPQVRLIFPVVLYIIAAVSYLSYRRLRRLAEVE